MDAVRQKLFFGLAMAVLAAAHAAAPVCTSEESVYQQPTLLFLLGRDAGEQRALIPRLKSASGWIEAHLSLDGLRLNYLAENGFELRIHQIVGQAFDVSDRPIAEASFMLNEDDRNCRPIELGFGFRSVLLPLPKNFWKNPDARRLSLRLWIDDHNSGPRCDYCVSP